MFLPSSNASDAPPYLKHESSTSETKQPMCKWLKKAYLEEITSYGQRVQEAYNGAKT